MSHVSLEETFSRWCKRRGVKLHRGQSAAALALIAAADSDPEVARFLMAIGAGRKYLMLQLASFFQAIGSGEVQDVMPSWMDAKEPCDKAVKA